MVGPRKGQLWPRSSLRDRNRCASLIIFSTDRIHCAAGFVTALSKSSGLEGAVTCHGSAFRFNPARPLTADSAGECPLYARAVVFFSSCVLLNFCRAWLARVYYFAIFRPPQFTKRRIRTFITMPNARNINRTEDPP